MAAPVPTIRQTSGGKWVAVVGNQRVAIANTRDELMALLPQRYRVRSVAPA